MIVMEKKPIFGKSKPPVVNLEIGNNIFPTTLVLGTALAAVGLLIAIFYSGWLQP